MNEQDEKLVRQSNWSGRRVVLLYWFAIVFLGTAAAAGLGSTILDPKYRFEAVDDTWHAAIGDPWHPDDCAGSGCHDDVIADWSGTWHAEIVGENDTSNNALNGSKVSFNSTHYWRTPNTPTNASDLTDMSNLQIWNYTELFNASGQQCCMTTRWYNVTGDPTNPAYENMTSNIWDIGVSCAACHPEPGVKSLSFSTCRSCHTPGGRQWMGYMQSEHYNSLSGLLASGDINSLTNLEHYIGQSTYMNVADLNASDYYTITCVTCHDPHDSSTNDGDESNAMSPWKNVYTGEVFGPGGSQLRAATVNDLCGTCHDISLNTSTMYFTDPSGLHVGEGLGCTDCHGYQWEPGHNATDRFGVTTWVNATFSSLSHNWVSPNDADDCGLCHGTENVTVWADMQTYLANFGNLTDAKALYDTKFAEATAKYDEASSTVGVDTSSLANAQALIEEAEDLFPEDSYFHNPATGTYAAEEQLSLALVKLDEAIVEADAAIAGAINPTVTENVTVDHTVEVDVTVDHTVDHTVEKPVTVEKTVIETTTTSAPAIGFLAVLGILGASAYFVRKRRN